MGLFDRVERDAIQNLSVVSGVDKGDLLRILKDSEVLKRIGDIIRTARDEMNSNLPANPDSSPMATVASREPKKIPRIAKQKGDIFINDYTNSPQDQIDVDALELGDSSRNTSLLNILAVIGDDERVRREILGLVNEFKDQPNDWGGGFYQVIEKARENPTMKIHKNVMDFLLSSSGYLNQADQNSFRFSNIDDANYFHDFKNAIQHMGPGESVCFQEQINTLARFGLITLEGDYYTFINLDLTVLKIPAPQKVSDQLMQMNFKRPRLSPKKIFLDGRYNAFEVVVNQVLRSAQFSEAYEEFKRSGRSLDV